MIEFPKNQFLSRLNLRYFGTSIIIKQKKKISQKIMPVTLAGKYELGRTLGSGVSCKCKIARDVGGKRYAIKIFFGNENL